MLKMENITFGYDLRDCVLADFSLTVPEGGRVCLYGASGTGKTTILRLAMGLEKPRQGSVFLSPDTKISAGFQEDRLIPRMTALENVSLFSSVEYAELMLCKLKMEEYLHTVPENLSGGQKRRVSLARALAHPFDLLILDEALTGLDEENRLLCLAAIDEAVGGRCLLMATHDLRDAEALGAERKEVSIC